MPSGQGTRTIVNYQWIRTIVNNFWIRAIAKNYRGTSKPEPGAKLVRQRLGAFLAGRGTDIPENLARNQGAPRNDSARAADDGRTALTKMIWPLTLRFANSSPDVGWDLEGNHGVAVPRKRERADLARPESCHSVGGVRGEGMRVAPVGCAWGGLSGPGPESIRSGVTGPQWLVLMNDFDTTPPV
jgi:hypothetical protein